MKQRQTIYHLIVDKSGSMSDCIENTLNGFNEQVNRIQKMELEFPDEDISIGLSTFNDEVKHHYFQSPPLKVQKLTTETYRPGGNTALLDAIGVTVKRIEKEIALANKKGIDATAVVVIITDGYENASTLFNLATIRSTISKLEESGKWTFSFIGATLDAVDIAEQMSIKKENSFSFKKSNMKKGVWDKLGDSMNTYFNNKSTGTKSDKFFDNN